MHAPVVSTKAEILLLAQIAAYLHIATAVCRTSATSFTGASQVAKYDDLIEEASGELDRVEGQLCSATQQLLDLQGRLSQLAQESHVADKTRLRVMPFVHLSVWAIAECNCSMLYGGQHQAHGSFRCIILCRQFQDMVDLLYAL